MLTWPTSWNPKGKPLRQRSSIPYRVMAFAVAALQVLPAGAWASDTKRAPAPAAPPAVRVNRTAPAVVPRPTGPQFSLPPLDAEFARLRVFDEPLIPSAVGSDSREDSELAGAIVASAQASVEERVARFESFLSNHPDSRWNGSLLLGLGLVYRRSGYFTRALGSWERSWTC